jgi:hypothetical protein
MASLCFCTSFVSVIDHCSTVTHSMSAAVASPRLFMCDDPMTDAFVEEDINILIDCDILQSWIGTGETPAMLVSIVDYLFKTDTNKISAYITSAAC